MTTPSPESEGSALAERAPDWVLVFTIDGREYAVPVGSVVEIVRHRGATPVPRSAPAVEGIVPVRERMVTLFDLRRCLGLPPRRPDAGARVIVVDSAGDRLGLVVDGVTRVAGPAAEVALLDLGAILQGVS